MPSLDASLWTEDAKASLYGGDATAYQAAILEQYKIYVKMADRISQRRGLTNTFFLTLNTAIFTAIGLFWEHKPGGSVWWLSFPMAMLLGECFAGFYLLRFYRLLNTAKYQVVGALETRLPYDVQNPEPNIMFKMTFNPLSCLSPPRMITYLSIMR